MFRKKQGVFYLQLIISFKVNPGNFGLFQTADEGRPQSIVLASGITNTEDRILRFLASRWLTIFFGCQ